MIDYGLTIEQRSNLMRLAIYLDTLPKDYTEFDMASFFEGFEDDTNGKKERKYARKNGGVASCGTSACAVGHGPSAGIPVPKTLIERDADGKWSVDWSGYSELFCPQTHNGYYLFNWMFGSGWDDVDNHHYGAAARIKFILMGEDIRLCSYSIPTSNHGRMYKKYRKRKSKGL